MGNAQLLRSRYFGDFLPVSGAGRRGDGSGRREGKQGTQRRGGGPVPKPARLPRCPLRMHLGLRVTEQKVLRALGPQRHQDGAGIELFPLLPLRSRQVSGSQIPRAAAPRSLLAWLSCFQCWWWGGAGGGDHHSVSSGGTERPLRSKLRLVEARAALSLLTTSPGPRAGRSQACSRSEDLEPTRALTPQGLPLPLSCAARCPV